MKTCWICGSFSVRFVLNCQSEFLLINFKHIYTFSWFVQRRTKNVVVEESCPWKAKD